MINAAIVGLGRWGRRLVDSVQKEGTPVGSNLRFSRGVVRTLANAKDYAASQKLILTNSLDDALSDTSIDAVVLATPHDEHPAQIIAATRAKKHVFVEKPLAFKRADAEAALQCVRDYNRVLAVGYNRRFLPAAAKLKEDVVKGTFGTLLRIEGNFSNNSGLNYRDGMWRATEHGAKAALSAMGVHILDFFIHLCGPINSVRTTSTRRSMPVEADDVVCVDLSFKNGVVGTLSTMLTTPRQWRVQVFGTSQWAHMRDEHLLDICGSSGVPDTLTFDVVDTLRLELEAFADAIEGGINYPISSDILHGVAALEAILESAANGGTLVVVPSTTIELARSN
jgi:predicted dehydrogenase